MDNDISNDVKDRLQLNKKGEGQSKGNPIDMVCKLAHTAIQHVPDFTSILHNNLPVNHDLRLGNTIPNRCSATGNSTMYCNGIRME